MAITCGEVIENFIAGVKEGDDGSVSSTKTVRIKGNQLIHYSTPIIERDEEGFILNISRYSLATGQLQKRMKEMLPEGYRTVKRVPQDYENSLKDFLEE
jgi:hypothetical protein